MWLPVDPALGVSALLNEEDHLRLQVFRSGVNLQEALREARALEDSLAEHVRFAKDAKLGFLTACPTNLGWGLRASVMLHLPALVAEHTAVDGNNSLVIAK